MCIKYIVENSEKDSKGQMLVWTTDQLKDLNSELTNDLTQNDQFGKDFISQISGFPLKTEFKSKEGGGAFELIQIKRQNLSAAEFQIPTGYELIKK